MTKHQEFPLRPQGSPWPGLNTKGGVLDPGQGFLEDGSKNQIINEADVLSKRLGFVRGLDERFDGVVCGLFRYTSGCGVEYLIVSDEDGIKVRTPFSIPEFLGSDSIPFDDFETLDTTRWSPTEAYQVFLGALQLSASDVKSGVDYMLPGQIMKWFKPSVVESYFVEINYRLAAFQPKQVASVVIKATEVGDTYLEAVVANDNTNYRAFLYAVFGGTRTTLGDVDVGGKSQADGFLRLNYDAGTRTATAKITPSGGGILNIVGELNEIQDASLGQISAVGLQRIDGTPNPEIESVSGGRI